MCAGSLSSTLLSLIQSKNGVLNALQGTGLTPQEVTQLNLDKSRLLDEVIAELYGGNADIMLGELQVTHVPRVLTGMKL